MTTSSSASTGPSMSARLIVYPASAGLLLPVVLDIIKPFYIKKAVTSANNATVMKTLKGTVWIVRLFFPFPDKTWQYMLGILDADHQLEFAVDVAHQQVLLAKIIGSEYKTMAKFLKRD